MSPFLQPGDLTAYLANPSEAEIELGRLFRPDEPLVICDIGACEGEDSIRYVRHFPRSRVLAFEPLPANQELARANFRIHGADGAELLPVALSDRAGQADFHVSSGRPSELFAGPAWNYGNKSSSLLAPAAEGPVAGWLEFKESIKVPTETLDGFCAARGLRHIDFIQMDVQGAERQVLAGAERILPHVTALWMEVSLAENYRGRALAPKIRHFMRKRGFKLCFEAFRDDGSGEGDHLYLNLRHPRTWGYAATRRLRSLLGNFRRRRHAP